MEKCLMLNSRLEMRKNNLIFALMIICSITIDGCNANNNANCIINEDSMSFS